jgi:hypothetical protein
MVTNRFPAGLEEHSDPLNMERPENTTERATRKCLHSFRVTYGIPACFASSNAGATPADANLGLVL